MSGVFGLAIEKIASSPVCVSGLFCAELDEGKNRGPSPEIQVGYRTSARMRTGAADPPVSFMGATMAMAPLAGMRSRLATLVRT
jgi:hypothetical protein